MNLSLKAVASHPCMSDCPTTNSNDNNGHIETERIGMQNVINEFHQTRHTVPGSTPLRRCAANLASRAAASSVQSHGVRRPASRTAASSVQRRGVQRPAPRCPACSAAASSVQSRGVQRPAPRRPASRAPPSAAPATC